MTAAPIVPVQAISMLDQLAAAPVVQQPKQAAPASFAQLVAAGVDNVNQKVLDADSAVRAFTLDDSIPVHQVTYALSQAQLSLELMMQVRSRLTEGYQQLMNMQL